MYVCMYVPNYYYYYYYYYYNYYAHLTSWGLSSFLPVALEPSSTYNFSYMRNINRNVISVNL